jgi:hypothetical protein
MASLTVWGVRMSAGGYWLKNAAEEIILFTREQAFDVAYGLTVQGTTWYACELTKKEEG